MTASIGPSRPEHISPVTRFPASRTATANGSFPHETETCSPARTARRGRGVPTSPERPSLRSAGTRRVARRRLASTTTTTTQAASTTTTTQAASSLAHIDWKNYTYEDFACGTLKAVKFTNGAWTAPGTKGTFAECSIHLSAVDYADVTGDGVPDAIVNLHGSASPVIEGQSDYTTVFTMRATVSRTTGTSTVSRSRLTRLPPGSRPGSRTP